MQALHPLKTQSLSTQLVNFAIGKFHSARRYCKSNQYNRMDEYLTVNNKLDDPHTENMSIILEKKVSQDTLLTYTYITCVHCILCVQRKDTWQMANLEIV